MSFPCDGTNHHNAIKNENSTKEFLQANAYKIYDEVEQGRYTVESRGGTSHKADNVILCDDGKTINISDKQKRKGLSTGSFDFTNTSSAIKGLLEERNTVVEDIQFVLDSVKRARQLPLEERKKLVDGYRKSIKDASYSTLVKLDSEDISYLIREFLIEPNRKQVILITDGEMNDRYSFPFVDHPVVQLVEDGYVPSIDVKNGKSSGRIIFTKDDETVDCGLRIRVHTNNGATALLNAGGSNKSSQFVLKFQQDGVVGLLNRIGVLPIEV